MKFLFALTFAYVVVSTFAQFDCGWNERWRSCKRDQNCEGIRLGGPVFLPPGWRCIAGCRCHTGQVRDDNDNCVWPEECFEPCPDPNQIRVPCAGRCPIDGTCWQPEFNNFCRIGCEVNGCQCRPGWLKLTPDNPVCVPSELCSLRLRQAGLAASGSASVEAEQDVGEN
nr:zonadhesin-like protein 3C [Limnephilus flavicornis]